MAARTPLPPTGFERIDGVVPGVRGQRAFPTRQVPSPDPFLMLDHIGPQRVSSSFAVAGHAHPHRGFETVTFLFEGSMEHADTLGNRFWMHSGAVQVMHAGSGIQHGGGMKAHPGHTAFHEVQLWVNVPARHKMDPPTVATFSAEEIPTVSVEGGHVRVVAGEFLGTRGPAQTLVPLLALHVQLRAGAEVAVPVPAELQGMVYTLRGRLLADSHTVEPHHLVRFADDGDRIVVTAQTDAEGLLLAGEPIGEPVAMGGPFVMNTRDEIRQAFADLEAGHFGTVPPAQVQR